MTTIAHRRGILATDTQITIGTRRMLGSKLQLVAPFDCFAFAGDCDEEEEFLHWYKAGSKWEDRIHKLKKVEAIQINKYGDVIWWNGYSHLPIVDDFFAIGSGEQIAVAFMHLGKTAIEAVGLAGQLDINTNCIVDYYNAKTGKIKRG